MPMHTAVLVTGNTVTVHKTLDAGSALCATLLKASFCARSR
jgi:hypothetical protein